ncbi:hypothetical protein Tco_1224189 [Tanacetum coccineum]
MGTLLTSRVRIFCRSSIRLDTYKNFIQSIISLWSLILRGSWHKFEIQQLKNLENSDDDSPSQSDHDGKKVQEQHGLLLGKDLIKSVYGLIIQPKIVWYSMHHIFILSMKATPCAHARPLVKSSSTIPFIADYCASKSVGYQCTLGVLTHLTWASPIAKRLMV